MTNPFLFSPSYSPSNSGTLPAAPGSASAMEKAGSEEGSPVSFRSVMQENASNTSSARQTDGRSDESVDSHQPQVEMDGEPPTTNEDATIPDSIESPDFDSGRKLSELSAGVALLLDAPEAVTEELGIDIDGLRVALDNSEAPRSDLSEPMAMAAPLLWASGNPFQPSATSPVSMDGGFVNPMTHSLSQAVFSGAQTQEGRLRGPLLMNAPSQSSSSLTHSALAMTTTAPVNTFTADTTGLSLQATINVDPEALDLSRFAGDKLFFQQKVRQGGDVPGLQVVSTEPSALHDSPLANGNLAEGFKGRIQVPMQVHFSNNHWPQNLAEQTAALLNQRVSSADIQLDPPELGPLQVRIQVHQDQATVNFVSANPQVREALDLGLMRLKEMLQEQGMQLVDSGVSDQSGGEHQEQTDGEPAAAHSGMPHAQQHEGEDPDDGPVTTSVPWGIDDFA